MKDKFSQFYRPTKEEFQEIWEEGLFVFDTNVLLNLYRYSVETKDKILSIMEEVNDRIWIPYNVAYEYHHNRISAINEQINKYDKITKSIDIIVENFNESIDKDKRNTHPYIDLESLKQKTQKFFNEIKRDLSDKKENHPDLFNNDKIRDCLDELFENRVGEESSREKLTEIYSEGKNRYERNFPPGYKDDNKKIKTSYDLIDNRKFGDLIIWKQIIEKAKETSKPIIFITDDSKEDWWWDQAGKTQGPRPELVKEIQSEANVKFYMYNSMGFLKYAKDFLSSDIEDKIIDEVKNVNENIIKFNNNISMMKKDKLINNLTVKNERLIEYLDRIINSNSSEMNTIELLEKKRDLLNYKLEKLNNRKNEELNLIEYTDLQGKIMDFEEELKDINEILNRFKIVSNILSNESE